MPVVEIAGKPRALHSWRRGAPVGGTPILTTFNLPSSVDLTPLLPPVNDQGQLGSCVANACCEALEFLERQGAADVPYSRLYLYYWARVREGVAPSVDSGLVISDAVATLQDRGVCLEALWPYDVNSFALEPGNACDDDAAGRRLLLAIGLPNLFTIKCCLAQGFVCAFGMDVFSSLMNTATGDVEMPAPGEAVQGGHAVVCCGYDDATQRLTFRNSWGSSWGRNGGNGTIPYQFVENSLATDFVTFRRATI